MAQFFAIHPENPQDRLIKQAVQIIKQGASNRFLLCFGLRFG